MEAQKFHNHYQAVGWRIGGKVAIVDWQAAAENWMLRTADFGSEPPHPGLEKSILDRDNLKTKDKKDYGEPL